MSKVVPTIMPPPKSIFSHLREAAGLSIEQAAELTGYRARTVYRWENGESTPRKAVLDALKLVSSNRKVTQLTKHKFTFVDLFAGIGGMRLAFEAAGGQCVASCEWNKYARMTYAKNFDLVGHPFYEDINDIELASIPAHDVLVAGFPCQPFSIAGVSKKNALGHAHGFACEAQGTLFFKLAQIIGATKPSAFLLENVKNLVSHDRGNTFRVIKDVLRRELGYSVQSRVVDAKGYVPQHRERTIIVGFAENVGFDLAKVAFRDPNRGPRLKEILHPEDGSERADSRFTLGDKAEVAVKYTLTRHLWKYLKDYAAKHKAAGNGFGYGLVGPEDVARTLSARYYKDGSEILVRQKGKPPRRLTPRECARLMGFDRAGSAFEIVVSDTQAYKQFGNAVVVDIIEEVARAMAPYVVRLKERRSTEPTLPIELPLMERKAS